MSNGPTNSTDDFAQQCRRVFLDVMRHEFGSEAHRSAGAMAKIIVAMGIARDPSRYTPGPHPERPYDLPDDEAIWGSVQCVRVLGRPAREDVETARRWVRYKDALMTAEARSKSRLTFLMGCVETLLEHPDDPQMAEAARSLSDHVLKWWPEAEQSKLPPKPAVAERDIFLSRCVRRTDLVSTWLLYGGRPSKYDPKVPTEDEPAPEHWSEPTRSDDE